MLPFKTMNSTSWKWRRSRRNRRNRRNKKRRRRTFMERYAESS